MSKTSSRRRSQRRYDPLAVLSYIARYQRQYAEQSPSQRRIRADLRISAPSVVHTIVHRLERQGLLTITTYGHGLPAKLTLTEEGQAAAQEWQRQQARPDLSDKP
jgi:Mn-dependent DtxR family transcriptional regulator